MLQAAVTALQQKEAALTRRLAEVSAPPPSPLVGPERGAV